MSAARLRSIVRLGRVRAPRFEWRDAVAGVTVAAVVVPQSIAYAGVAGLSPQYGLYAAALPLIAAALFASSPYLQTGPVAITALLTLGALSAHATPYSAEYGRLALLLALGVGVVRLGIGIAGGGVVAYLMSQPMMAGFVPAATILIVASQVPTVLGTSSHADSPLVAAVQVLVHPGSWSYGAILIGVAVGAAVVLLPRIHQLVPAVLLAVVGSLAYSKAIGYDGRMVGHIPVGPPPISLSLPWGRASEIALASVVIAVVGFAEPAAIARTFAALDRRRWDANREFVAQGVANVVAGLSGGMPVGGSFSRSALNRLAGARTSAAGAITGLVGLAFLFTASALAPLPSATLAAIVIVAVRSLIRTDELRRLYRYSTWQFAVAASTFVATLAFAPHVEYAILLGVALAAAVHLNWELRLALTHRTEGDTLHLRPSGVLWYGSVHVLEELIGRQLADHADIHRVVIHCDGLGRIDVSGALLLRQLLEDSAGIGLQVELDGVPAVAEPVVTRVLGDLGRR